MQDYYGGSLDGATDRYLDDYAEASERLDDCKECALCSGKIYPDEDCKMISPWVSVKGINTRIDLWCHVDCLDDAEEFTGEEAMDE